NAIGPSGLFLKLYYFLSFRIEFLRHLRSFFQIMFKIETKTAEEEHMGGEKVLMTCVGIGFCNLSKTIR
ncbi:RCL1 protein, partial [Sylvia borin]|nr:RCL1 protein [Sylvia borin]